MPKVQITLTCDVCKKDMPHHKARVSVTPDDHVMLLACSRKCQRNGDRSRMKETLVSHPQG